MLTGDNAAVAPTITQQLGIDLYQWELLPEDKVSALESFLQHQGEDVANFRLTYLTFQGY